MSRGQSIVALPLSELLSIILVAVLVAGIGIFLVRAVFAGNANEETASIYSMFSLAHVVRDVVANPALFETKNTSLYVSDKLVLVGFPDGKQGASYYTTDEGKITYVETPRLCGAQACLCLYRADLPISESNVVSCVQLSGVNSVLTLWNSNFYYREPRSYDAKNKEVVTPLYEQKLLKTAEDTIKGYCYNNGMIRAGYAAFRPQFVCNGDACVKKTQHICDTTKQTPITQYASLVFFGKGFKTQSVYVEKVVVDGLTQVLVTLPLQSKMFTAREADITKKMDEISIQELTALFNAAGSSADDAQSIAFYEKYLARVDATDVAKRATAKNNIIVRFDNVAYLAGIALGKTPSQELALQYVRALAEVQKRYEGQADTLVTFNRAQNELVVACNNPAWSAWVAHDAACRDIPVVDATMNLQPEKAKPCSGIMARCDAAGKDSFACINDVWQLTPCNVQCKNEFSSTKLSASCS